ncbi:hypothetical protein BASA81_001987 [Batrachochytrium salamandrivorans]|nr:hypothetical protein BASA81_001987 [Batrachochytrium salamandrivorans]
MELGFGLEYAELVLLDASNEEIRKALDSGDLLSLKGQSEDDAVLCTRTQTFQLFAKETSNELLLVEGQQIQGAAHQVLEPVLIPPRLDQLKHMLEDNAKLLQEEGTHKRQKINRLTFDKLSRESGVQASEAEIQAGLIESFAYEDDAVGWVCPDRQSMEQVTTQFLLCLVAHQVEEETTLLTLQEDAVCDWLSEFPPQLVRAVLFTGGQVQVDRIKRFKAECLLAQSQVLALNEFVQLWRDGVAPLQLAGSNDAEAVTTLCREFALMLGEQVRYFPRTMLPRNAKSRLQRLFDLQPFWGEADLDFYLQGVEGGASGAIARFCRMSKQGDCRGYIKKMV